MNNPPLSPARRGFVQAASLGAVAAAWPAQAQPAPVKKIRLRLEDDQSAVVALSDSAAARDLISLLPLELTLENYAQERIAHLPRKLSTQGAPKGVAAHAGDFNYYAPWGNLAIFLQDFRYSAGLLHLGRVDSGLDILQRNGPFRVRIEGSSE